MGKIIERISMGLDGAEANGASKNAVMTPDGRYIVFESEASNLVAGDTNGVSDIFRYDTTTGEMLRVSVGDGTGAAGNSSNATVTADGRYIAFESLAENLVMTDTNDLRDVFVRDMETGVTMMVSGRPEIFLQSEGGTYGSSNPTITALNGDILVAFSSDATNLDPADTNGTRDIFLKSVNDYTIYRMSNTNSGAQSDAFSGPYTSIDTGLNQLLIAFSSQDDLTSNSTGTDVGAPPDFPDGYPVPPTTEAMELYLTDGEYAVLVSLATGASLAGNGHSIEATLAFPYIIYTTNSTNLYGSNDTNSVNDVYVYNYLTQTVTLVSMAMDGMAGNGASGGYARLWIAADNTPHATFSSAASNLVSGDTNGQIDFFLRDLGGMPKTILLSDPGHGIVSDGASTGFSSGGANFSTSGAPYGSFVFTSAATNMVSGDTNGFTDIFRIVRFTKDPSLGTTSDITTAATEQVAVVVDAGVVVSDEDSANLTQAIVTISGNYQQGQDVLQFTTIGTITGVFNAATGTLTLTGTGTAAEYQAALRTVTYLNTSDTPNTGDRTISFVVDDGVDFSISQPKTVSVMAADDAPTDIVLTGTSVWEYAATNSVVGTLSSVDVDSGTFTYTLLDDAEGRFVVVGNEIRVADGLLIDFEQQSSHQIEVLVTDETGLTHTETLTLTVLNINNETVVGDGDGNVFVGGSGNDNLSGLGGSDILIGNTGNDTLDAGDDGVVDVLIGGMGNDSYALWAGLNDILVDTGGVDTVTTTISRVLAGSLSVVENLMLLGVADINGTGNGLGNWLVGNEGANSLKGLGGTDRLDGGAGIDKLYGGQGADLFIFDLGDTGASKDQADTIFDMQGAKGDRIDLHLIDANLNRSGNQAFNFIGTDKFSGRAGELRFVTTKSDAMIYGDTNGDKIADFVLYLDDAMAMKAGYFLL